MLELRLNIAFQTLDLISAFENGVPGRRGVSIEIEQDTLYSIIFLNTGKLPCVSHKGVPAEGLSTSPFTAVPVRLRYAYASSAFEDGVPGGECIDLARILYPILVSVQTNSDTDRLIAAVWRSSQRAWRLRSYVSGSRSR